MFKGNFKMAVSALRAAKWRSILTMIGIVVGVVSVVSTVALGEGIKQQLIGQINQLGNDIVTIRPGKIVERDKDGRIVKVNVSTSYNFTSGSLPARDLDVIKDTKGVKTAVPIGTISGSVKNGNQEYSSGSIIATNTDMATILKVKVAYGTFFDGTASSLPVAVIGRTVADQLFNETAPIGMTLTIHGQDFIVRGVLDSLSASPLTLGPDFNKAVFIPYDIAQSLTGGNTQLEEVLAQSADQSQTNQTIAVLNRQLLLAHGQQQDFTVLRQDENLAVTDDILNTLTAFIAGIAAISLIVGGVGIMNIMLVSVSERTREIGVRKALGATNSQILGQFLVESVVLSSAGSALGLLLSVIVVITLRLSTHLQPVITWPIVLIACSVAIIVGAVFGIAPAAKAASKDPIDALRYE
ncbi:MAG: ABC transporter permease [Candidatus Saccharimonadales bacterium]